MIKTEVIFSKNLAKKIVWDQYKRIGIPKKVKRWLAIGIGVCLGAVSVVMINHDKRILPFLAAFFLVGVGMFLLSILRTYQLFERIESGYSFWVSADEEGVVLYDEAGQQLPIKKWEAYRYYVEHDNYLSLHEEKSISFLPKSDELSALLALTKKHIREKE